MGAVAMGERAESGSDEERLICHFNKIHEQTNKSVLLFLTVISFLFWFHILIQM